MTQTSSDYAQRKSWTLQDHLDHNKDTVKAFRDRFGDEQWFRWLSLWQGQQLNPSCWRPSEEDFIAGLQKRLMMED